MKLYICVDGGPVVGPVRLDQVIRGLAVGKVPADALACREGESDWHPVSTLLDELDDSEQTVVAIPLAEDAKARRSELADDARKAPTVVPGLAGPGIFRAATCTACNTTVPIPADRRTGRCVYCGPE